MSIDWSEKSDSTHVDVNTHCFYKKVDGKWMLHVAGDRFTSSSSLYNGETKESDLLARHQPKQWSGPQDGLPPVGTVCEFAGGTACPDDPWHQDLKEGAEVTVIAHFDDGTYPLVAFTFKATNPNIGRIQVEQARPACFRPLKTTEQLAAEQRETAIREIMDIADVDCRVTAARLVDAGFKREVV